MFAVDKLSCMCLAALWSSVGKGVKAVVTGPAGAAFAPLSRFGSFFFELTSDFI